ncbi:SOS response-associated peptidase family protein [Streptomyces sp. NPDC005732]|uniref:SOS response-associated peptidase family protein n=1 Tax=Streptomyces sp. NPDC005732 TaxID=3157057 RepID=UPI0034089440
MRSHFRKGREQPYFIHPEDDQGKALARFYEYRRSPDIEQDDDPTAWLMTCIILTTEATDAAGRVHPRMPLALAPENYDAWLDLHHHDPGRLRALLTQPAGEHLHTRPVSTAVNSRLVSATPPYPPADILGAVEGVELSDGAQLRELNACSLQQLVFLCCEAGTDARWP